MKSSTAPARLSALALTISSVLATGYVGAAAPQKSPGDSRAMASPVGPDSARELKSEGLLGSVVVRVPHSALGELHAAGIAAEGARDYGSFLWLEVTLAELAKLEGKDIQAEIQHGARQVQVTAHRFDPLSDGEPDVLLKASQADGRGFRLVQFEGPVKEQWLQSLHGAGLAPLQYYPHHAYLVWSEGRATEALAPLDFVRWHGAFHPSYKLNRDLEGRSGRIGNVTVVFYDDGNTEQVLQTLRDLGARILGHHPSQPDRAFLDAVVEIDAASLQAVAALESVLWLGYSHPEPVLEDEMSSQILAGNHPGGTPVTGYLSYLSGLGYTGAGVRWAVVDTGVDYDHPDLGPSIVAGYSFPGACDPAGQPGSDCSGGGHGTHVAGIIGGTAAGTFADAAGFLYGLGVAPSYGIVAMNSLSGSSWPPTGGWQEHSKRAVLLGAVGTNNSWTSGEGTAHGYQASERTHDLMVHDGNFDTAAIEPIIWVFSAGNSGPNSSTITSPKEAKNTIVVGSSRNFRVGSIDTLSGFSSRGPAVDGRILPTISAPGEEIASSRNDLGGSCSTAIAGTNNLYAFCSGTSMAAPQVAGALALATEWWRDFNLGANPSPAMAKALLVNSAIDMGAADRPNNNEGWGRISVERMIATPFPTIYRDQEVVFTDTGDSFGLTVAPAVAGQPVQITVAWSDAAGAIGANPALVNNLDLVVEDGGNTYRGNVFSAGWSTTGGTADTLNNLENVFIQSPSGGAIDITVAASNIAGDGVLGNADLTDQSFALVCSNCVSQPDYTLSLDPATLSICAPDQGITTVTVGQLLGYTDAVNLSVSGVPAGLSAAFGSSTLTPPDATQLSVSDTHLGAPGSYAMLVQATSTSGDKQRQLNLDLFSAVPTAPDLLLPADGALDVPVSPTLSWDAAPEASNYLLEVASDAGFGTIVFSQVVSGTSQVVSGLSPANAYFWRVRAENGCGNGSFSTVRSFTTVAEYCATPNIAVPDNNVAGVNSTISVASGGTLEDLDVVLQANHTYIGDLVVTLNKVGSGTTISLIDRPGVPASTFGCSGDNPDIILDDESGSAVETSCTNTNPGYPVGGRFSPNQALASFDGVDFAGDWTMNVSDRAGGDTGTLLRWCLEPSINRPPVMEDQTFAVNENSANGTSVATIAASDPNAGDVLSFAVTGGSGAGAFAVNSGSGEITVSNAAPLDFEANASFTLLVTVTDSGMLSDSATITVNLNDVNEAPTVADQDFAVDENSANGTSVGTVVASDPDAGEVLIFAVTGGSGENAFAVNASSGAITVSDASLLDFETSPSLTLQVTVSDSGMLSDSATITINLNDVNEAPIAAALADQAGAEGVPFTVDTSTAFIDPDGDTLAYAAAGLPASLGIDPSSGVIFGVPLVGDAGAYTVTATASDGSLQAQSSFELMIEAASEGIFRDGYED